MKKSKGLIGLIVSTGLMVNIFLAIPIKAQIAETTERERLKAEIKEKFKIRAEIKGKIKTIEKTVNRLKNAKIAIPIIIGAAGISATVIVAAIATAPLLIFMLMRGKIKNLLGELSKLKENLKLLGLKETTEEAKKQALKEIKKILVHSDRSKTLFINIRGMINSLELIKDNLSTLIIKKEVGRAIELLKTPGFVQADTAIEKLINIHANLKKRTPGLLQSTQEKIQFSLEGIITDLEKIPFKAYPTAEVLQYIKESLWWLPQKVTADLRKTRLTPKMTEYITLNTWLDSAKKILNNHLSKFTIPLLISIVPPFVVLFSGIIGTSVLSIGTLLGLSAASMKQTIKLAEELRLLEKKYPGMLTRKERQILAQLKKFSKNPITRSIIENLRLKGALQKNVITAMQQHPSLVARMGKKADKTLSKYIQRRWEAKKLQRALDEITKKGFTSAINTIRLKDLKRKLNKIEKRYPDLKPTLTKAVKIFGTTADGIVEELKKQILKQADLKALELLEKPELPVVPL